MKTCQKKPICKSLCANFGLAYAIKKGVTFDVTPCVGVDGFEPPTLCL